MVDVRHDEGEVTFELAVCGAYCLDEIARVVALDEMRHDLGVGLGAEDVRLELELVAKLAEVLDDAVENDGDRSRRSP